MSVDNNQAGEQQAGAGANANIGMLSGIRAPPQLLINNGVIEEWKLWKQAWDNYVIVSRLNKQDQDYQAAMFLNTIGPPGLRIYNSFELNEESRNLEAILQKFSDYAVGEINETVERYVFNKRVQNHDENFETYLASLRVLTKTCNFEPLTDSLIRDRIIVGIQKDDSRQLLLRESKLTLAKAITICKGNEAAENQAKAFKESVPTAVNKITRKPQGAKPKKTRKSDNAKPERDCWYCGYKHIKDKNACPALGKKCNTCGGKDHFAKMCKQANSNSSTRPK
jgi:hypothetical protein